MMDFNAFNLPKGLTAIVGGGGKTTLMMRLGLFYSKSARVIISTSTHIQAPDLCELLLSPAACDIQSALRRTSLIAVGSKSSEGKLSACDIPWETLTSLCDYVIVEADGSKRLPLKAPAAHEPVLPENTAFTIAVAGIDGIGRRIADAAHRPELYAKLVDKDIEAVVTPSDVARVVSSENGQRKNVRSRFAAVLNKVSSPQQLAYAREAAALIDEEVFITALQSPKNAIIEHMNREAK